MPADPCSGSGPGLDGVVLPAAAPGGAIGAIDLDDLAAGSTFGEDFFYDKLMGQPGSERNGCPCGCRRRSRHQESAGSRTVSGLAMTSPSDGGGEQRSAGKTDRTAMGPLDQAPIRSRPFPAGRPQQARSTDPTEDSSRKGWVGRMRGQIRTPAWGYLDTHSGLTGEWFPVDSTRAAPARPLPHRSLGAGQDVFGC